MNSLALQEGTIVLDPFAVRIILGLVTLALIVISCVTSQRKRTPYADWWRAARFPVKQHAFPMVGQPCG